MDYCRINGSAISVKNCFFNNKNGIYATHKKGCDKYINNKLSERRESVSALANFVFQINNRQCKHEPKRIVTNLSARQQVNR